MATKYEHENKIKGVAQSMQDGLAQLDLSKPDVADQVAKLKADMRSAKAELSTWKALTESDTKSDTASGVMRIGALEKLLLSQERQIQVVERKIFGRREGVYLPCDLTMDEALDWLDEALCRSTATNSGNRISNGVWEQEELRLAVDVDEALRHVAKLGEVPKQFVQDAMTIKALELVSKFPEQTNTLRTSVLATQRMKILVDRYKEAAQHSRKKQQVKTLKDQVESLTNQVESLKDQVESLKDQVESLEEQVKCLQK
jgi:predicted RNase H-like nuclease (RuvC/YqgF family)